MSNLKPFTSEQSREKAVENGRKGGIASGIAKREARVIKKSILDRMNEDDWNEYIDGIIDRAKHNRQDAEFLRDTIGQKPMDKVVQTNIDAEYVASVEYITKLLGEDL